MKSIRTNMCRVVIALIATMIAYSDAGRQQVFAQRANAQQAPAPQAAKYRYWTSDWSFEDIEIGTLADRLERIGIEIPVKLDGVASVNFQVSIPLNALRTPEAYRIEGTLTGRNLQSDRLVFDSLRAEVDYRDGKLLLKNLDAKQGEGQLQGTASMKLIPKGDFAGTLTLSRFRTEAVFELLSKFGGDWAEAWSIATLEGQVNVTGKTAKIDDPLSWNIDGQVNARNVQYGPKIAFDVEVPGFKLQNKQFQISKASVTSTSEPRFEANLDGTVDISDTPKLALTFAADDFPVGSFTEVVEGKIDVSGKVTGVLTTAPNTPDRLKVKAALASPRLKVAGLDLGRLEHDIVVDQKSVSLTPRQQPSTEVDELAILRSISADYDFTPAAISITNLDANLFGGRIQGGLNLAVEPDGIHQFKVDWENLAPRYTVQLPIASRPIAIEASTTGKVDWRVPAAKLDQPFAHNGSAILRVNQFVAGGENLGRLIAEVSISDDGLEAAVDGEILGGRLSIHTTTAPDAQASWENLLQHTVVDQLSLQDVSLDQASVVVGQQPGTYSGRADLKIGNLDLQKPDQPFDASVNIRAFRIGNVDIAPTLAASVAVHPGWIEISSIQGVYAGGRLDGQGVWALTPQGRKSLSLRLSRAIGSHLLLPISPDAKDWVSGIVSGQVTVTGSGKGVVEKLRISGNAMVDNAATFNLPVGDAHSSLVVTFDTSSGRWTADFPNVKSKLAGGRVSGKLHLASPASNRGALDLDSRWRVAHVDFERLLSTYVGTATIGQGDVTGDLALSGRRIVDARNLRGNFRFHLGGTDASAVPGLSTAGVLLGATSLVGTRFNEGVASGRIASGAIMLDEVAMVSDRVAVKAAGRVGLLDTRMDVGVVLSTGNFQGQDLLVDMIGLSDLLLTTPFGQINRVLSDRTFVLEINGSARSPIVRLLPGESVRANLRRYAFQELITVSIADSLFAN
ncbi:DUF3971 domain-containing protein [Stieleria sp. JC731]|uniref:DUF3971 domain-containing protein n=1 Tax=Pirellulaceae TaxID=2691357 RepID=UPI001E6379EE|nr:DUF3971 domain-containing protein [Stieleria sp. JC731]MCC9602767.1 DUF3971 domain-containing protein [Stieleria sp. JC731]